MATSELPAERPANLATEPLFDERLNRSVEVVEREVIVRFKRGLQPSQIQEFLKEVGAESLRSNEALRTHRIRIPEGISVAEFVRQHASDPSLLVIEPNFIATALASDSVVPDDPLFSSQWSIATIEADRAWQTTTGNTETVVAVLDTGVDASHPDLSGKVLAGWNFVSNTADAQDDHGHGTRVAGIIAARANNQIGVAGLAWGSPVLPVKVLSASGLGSYADVADGVVYAADRGARVLNLSIGGYSYSQLLLDAVEYARSRDAVLVAAAGNDGADQPVYPAAYPGVIAVAATDQGDGTWAASNHGQYVTLSAPGTNVLTTSLGSQFAEITGTSAAAAVASGIAALIRSGDANLSSDDVERILYVAADDLGAPGRDAYFGYGRVNADKAVLAAAPDAQDVAILSVRIEPATIEPGQRAAVVLRIANQGTQAVAGATVEIFLADASIGRSVLTSLLPSASTEIEFEWEPPAEIAGNFVLRAEIAPLRDEEDLADNALTVNYRINPDAEGRLRVLFEVEPAVHQWITCQAVLRLDYVSDAALKTEISNYDGAQNCSETMFVDPSPSWSPPQSWKDDPDSYSGTATALLEGTWEEDNPWTRVREHFWNPTDFDPQFGATTLELNNGIVGFDSAAVHGNDLFKMAIEAYQSNPPDKATAYWLLGRTAHLLEDLASPAHVHNDFHLGHSLGFTVEIPETDHFVTALASVATPPRRFRQYSWSSPGTAIPSQPFENYPGSSETTLQQLFYSMASRTERFDSSDGKGDVDRGQCNHFKYRLSYEFFQGLHDVTSIKRFRQAWGGYIANSIDYASGGLEIFTGGPGDYSSTSGQSACSSGSFEFDVGGVGDSFENIKRPAIYLSTSFRNSFDDWKFYDGNWGSWDVLVVDYVDSAGVPRSVEITGVVSAPPRPISIDGVYDVVPSSVVERNYENGNLLPEAIGHVAALYRLFWSEVNTAPAPPCYDSIVSLAIGAAPLADGICEGSNQKYVFPIVTGRAYRVSVVPGITGNPDLYLHGSSDVSETISTYASKNAGTQTDSYRFTAPSSGNYYAAVYGYAPGTSSYTIAVADVTSAPAVVLTANPMSVELGSSATLSWSTTGTTTCAASGTGWNGPRATNGMEVVSPTVTSTYTLTCTGPGGVDADGASVEVLQHDHTLVITGVASGSPGLVASGGSASLSVNAEDTAGHGLGYVWTASCPGLASGGRFNNGTIRTPLWMAPENTTGSQHSCQITVVVGDGWGLSQQSSYTQFVGSANHTLSVVTAAQGNPNPVLPGAQAALTVQVADSVGHPVSYGWTAMCPGLPSNGIWFGTSLQSPKWQAPQNSTGVVQNCTMAVVAMDGTGLSQPASFSLGVSPGGVTSLSISDGIRLLESPPYELNGQATVDAEIKNTGAATVFIDRLQASGEFALQTGPNVWTRDWPAVTFDPPLSLAPGSAYRYTRLMTESFPGEATIGSVMMFVKFDTFPGQDPITSAVAGGTARIEFPVGHAVTITTLPSGTQNPVASEGTVVVYTNANDSFGHAVQYDWNATCAGLPSNGNFALSPPYAPSWTAPLNKTGSQQSCTIEVTVSDGLGLSDQASYSQGVNSIPHTLAITAAPTGTPNPVYGSGAVGLQVIASDSLEHALNYGWTASCPGLPSNGSFSDPAIRTPTWTAPENETQNSVGCTLGVTVNDGQGLNEVGSYTQTVSQGAFPTMDATPSTIPFGSSSTITWTTANATGCTASGGWSGARPANGNEVVSPATTTTYTLVCSGPQGSASNSVAVTVIPPATVSLHACPTTIAPSASTTLVWATTDATSCTATGTGWSGPRPTSGSAVVSPSAATTYSMSCTGVGGTGNDSVMVTVASGSAVLYVDDTAAGNDDGTSWVGAYVDLQDGFSCARSGDEIWVAQGTYRPTDATDRTATFQLVNGVRTYGGFVGTEIVLGQRDPSANPTVLSGDLAGNDGVDFLNNDENSYIVVTGGGVGPTAVLDGFTIRGGNANGSNPYNVGAGIRLFDSVTGDRPTLRNLQIVENKSNVAGGGIGVGPLSAPTLDNVALVGNEARYFGGGLYTRGNPILSNVDFVANEARLDCGGGLMVESGMAQLTRARFIGNLSQKGGALCAALGGTATVANGIFTGNQASAASGGGAIWLSSTTGNSFINVSIAQNTALNNSGGMFVESSAGATLTNAVLWGNSDGGGSGESAQIKRAWVGSPVTISYSIVQGWAGGFGGVGNNGSDPLFSDPDGLDNAVGTLDDDLRLRAGSPAIDAGTNAAAASLAQDLDGNFRFLDDPYVADTGSGSSPLVDRGPYEFDVTSEPESDGDGIPDGYDNCPTNINANQADADDDGVGDVCDNCPAIVNPSQLNFDQDATGDACDIDDDNDGLTDENEINLHGTNPMNPDTDGDGYSDGQEVQAGSDPLDANSTPAAQVPAFSGTGLTIYCTLLFLTGLWFARRRSSYGLR